MFLQAGDPVGFGFVANLARPGGNLTGFTNYEPSMGDKWLEILKEISPDLARVGALFNPKTHTGQFWRVLETAAPSIGLVFSKMPAQDVAELDRAIEGLAREGNGGLLVMPDIFTVNNRERIIALAAQHRLPAMYPFRTFAKAAVSRPMESTTSTCTGVPRATSIESCAVQIQPSCRSRRRPSSS